MGQVTSNTVTLGVGLPPMLLENCDIIAGGFVLSHHIWVPEPWCTHRFKFPGTEMSNIIFIYNCNPTNTSNTRA